MTVPAHRPEADFVQFAAVACGIRVVLSIVVVLLAVAIRQGTERLVSRR
jgi:hypothetical protein